MKAKDINQLAEEVTRELFSSGYGIRAGRLVLESRDEKDLGGWCFDAVLQRITKALYTVSNDKPTAKKK